MKCPFCNAWTDVRETRDGRRRRGCANGHRFSTQEVVVMDSGKRAKAIADAVVLKGMTTKQAAELHGIRSDSYASRCVKRYYPEFVTRSDGQRRRFARERGQLSQSKAPQ